MCLEFPLSWSSGRKKNQKNLNGFNVLGWTPLNDVAAGVVGVGYKTGLTTLIQIDGMRLSETKGAHES